jgi:hypothetical protein
LFRQLTCAHCLHFMQRQSIEQSLPQTAQMRGVE